MDQTDSISLNNESINNTIENKNDIVLSNTENTNDQLSTETIPLVLEEQTPIISSISNTQDVDVSENTSLITKEQDKLLLNISIVPEQPQDTSIVKPVQTLSVSLTDNKSLLEILSEKYEELKQNPDAVAFVQINPTVMRVLGILLSNNKIIFDEFESSVETIMKDNKLSIRDVPELIKLLKLIYSKIISLKIKNIPKTIYIKVSMDVVYTVFAICIDVQLIKVNNPQQCLRQLREILESCSELIELSLEYKKWWLCC